MLPRLLPRSILRAAVALALAGTLFGLHARAEEWPGFRGPRGDGTSTETALPVKWGLKENVAWKTPLPGPGASSPVVWGERVFVTCWTGYADGKNNPGDITKLRRHLVCVDRATGKILWKTDEAAKQPEVEWSMPMRQHGYATSTPVTDGKLVYAFFGKTGVRAFDFDGNERWRAETGRYINTFGSGASPALWKDLLIVNASVEGGGLIALHKASGKPVWKTKLLDCWTTPLVAQAPGGREELIVLTQGALMGLDPASGKELWQCEFPEPGYVSANPVVRDGVAYVTGSGTQGKATMAVKLGGSGDVTRTHVLWKKNIGASYASPVLAGDRLYLFNELAHCLNLKNGEIVYRERLPGLGKEYSSPVAAGGRIYVFTRDGSGIVLAAGDKLEVLARNTLGDEGGFTASPAVHRGQILVRSNTHLYCLGGREK